MEKFLNSKSFHWVIATLFTAWFLVVPLFVGLFLLYKKSSLMDEQGSRTKALSELDQEIEKLKKNKQNEIDDTKLKLIEEAEKIKIEASMILNNMEKEADIAIQSKQSELDEITKEIQDSFSNLENIYKESIVSDYNFSSYDGYSSEECKNKLSLLKVDEQGLIKSNEAFFLSDTTNTKKMTNNNIKKLIRCFNAECDNVFLNLNAKNVDSMRSKIAKSFESLNKVFVLDGIVLNKKLLEIKLEELNLVYTYELKKDQEREEQKAIREQMLEEEKIRREIEREKDKIAKEETQFKNEVNKLMSYLQKASNDIEKALYIDKIKELEDKLKALEKDKENVLQRELNTRAGYVYIISNIGAFGENIYKIGMTRRLEPMDRVKELSDASVPFPFDVHAMIFSDDAPCLENTLHQTFKKYEVNKVNSRKEFFKVDLYEIEKIVKQNHNATVHFTLIADANEYRQSLKMSCEVDAG